MKREHRNSDRGGFTLVEMMVVLAIISILSAVMMPSLNRMRSRETSREFAHYIANNLKQVQRHSRTQGQALRVTIKPGNGKGIRGSIEVKRGKAYCREHTKFPGGGSTGGGSPGSPVPVGKCKSGAELRPPSTCSELAALEKESVALLVPFETEELKFRALEGIGEGDYIVGTSVGGGTNTDVELCFSPDGRILSKEGYVLEDDGGLLCSGENFALYTMTSPLPDDLGFPATIPALGKCASNSLANLEMNRDQVNFYRIVLPYRGTIRVSQ